jgi:NitT/TauT family transport system ATP-binding protein
VVPPPAPTPVAALARSERLGFSRGITRVVSGRGGSPSSDLGEGDGALGAPGPSVGVAVGAPVKVTDVESLCSCEQSIENAITASSTNRSSRLARSASNSTLWYGWSPRCEGRGVVSLLKARAGGTSVVAPRSEGPIAIEASELSIVYRKTRTSQSFTAVRDVSFVVKRGELVSLIGPSGCGKSSILAAVAGLVPYIGSVSVFGSPISRPGPDRGVVFQAASLLPWRSVERNVRYGLELQHVPKAQAIEATDRALELVGLMAFKDSYPNELSGGMQQRVNFARALVGDPLVLLMDEPFAALDAQTRERLQLEIVDLWQKADKAGIFVTHQIDEAVFLADRVVVLGPGPESEVIEVFDVPLPRPRTPETRNDPVFLELVTELRRLFDLA